MSNQHPDRDSLSAYLEKSLSIDAAQWTKQHLDGCAVCRAKLEQEQVFLDELDRLASIEPPADFTEGVMARVAQCPAFQPGTELPWKRVALWVGSAAAMFTALAIFVGWVLVVGSSGAGAETSGGASSVVATGAEWAKTLYFYGRDNTSGIRYVLEIGFGFFLGIFDFVRNAGLMVQLALLLATVALNYGLTRMVLNYQRRH
jgi:hypothetical protein